MSKVIAICNQKAGTGLGGLCTAVQKQVQNNGYVLRQRGAGADKGHKGGAGAGENSDKRT